MQGTWQGILMSKSLDNDNKDGLQTTLTIVDDNNSGNYTGEMIIYYKYQTDYYKARYKVVGKVDYSNYTLTLSQTEFIYGDLLPKGLQWCIGGGNFRIFRSSSTKKYYMDGTYETNFNEKYRMVLFKK